MFSGISKWNFTFVISGVSPEWFTSRVLPARAKKAPLRRTLGQVGFKAADRGLERSFCRSIAGQRFMLKDRFHTRRYGTFTNVLLHVGSRTLRFFERRLVECLKWPACSFRSLLRRSAVRGAPGLSCRCPSIRTMQQLSQIRRVRIGTFGGSTQAHLLLYGANAPRQREVPTFLDTA